MLFHDICGPGSLRSVVSASNFNLICIDKHFGKISLC